MSITHTIYHVVTPSGTVTFIDQPSEADARAQVDPADVITARQQAESFIGDNNPEAMLVSSVVSDEGMELLRAMIEGVWYEGNVR